MAKISMNSTATRYCNIVEELKIAHEIGFEGVEINYEKMFRFLDAGYSVRDLLTLLNGMEVVGIGAVQNIEGDGKDRTAFLNELRRVCQLGEQLGTTRVQICTGPSDVDVVQAFYHGKLAPDDTRYRGLLGVSEEELIDRTAENVALAADIAAEHGINLYMEPLAWVPLGKIAQAEQVIAKAGRKNVGVAIDFWHMWTTQETPEYVASLDKSLIQIVHICDGIEFDGDGVPNQDILRNVWTGEGDIPLKRWIDAVKATGYDGWYSTEIFSNKIYERDPRQTARLLKENFEYMLGLSL